MDDNQRLESTLNYIKNRVVNGGSISNNDYHELLHAAKNGVGDAQKYAQSILYSYNYRTQPGRDGYKTLTDPFKDVSNRDKSAEEAYGRLGNTLY